MKEIIEMVEDPKDAEALTRNLIRIPSYVYTHVKNDKSEKKPVSKKERVDEISAAKYIESFLTKYTKLKVSRQEVEDKRFNIIASNSPDPKLLLLGHIDTVRPSLGGEYPPFGGVTVDNKIYGLGAADMKSGLACILSALAMEERLPPLSAFFYIDEEYDFLGMKKIIEEFSHLEPTFILSADGGNLGIGNGCRGLVEIRGTLLGQSAHAGVPWEGRNAINNTVDLFRDLELFYEKNIHPILGKSTVNLAKIEGGKAAIDEKTGEYIIVEQINAVSDISKFIVDTRPASLDLNAETIARWLKERARLKQVSLKKLEAKGVGPWFTREEDLGFIKKAFEKFKLTTNFGISVGYIDLQMLWEILGRNIPAATLGPGEFSLAHKPDEYVEIARLIECRNLYREIIRSFV